MSLNHTESLNKTWNQPGERVSENMNEFLYDLFIALIGSSTLAGYIFLAIKMKWIQIQGNFNYEEINDYIEKKVAEEIAKIQK